MFLIIFESRLLSHAAYIYMDLVGCFYTSFKVTFYGSLECLFKYFLSFSFQSRSKDKICTANFRSMHFSLHGRAILRIFYIRDIYFSCVKVISLMIFTT